MATSLTQPDALSQPFANLGDRATIPDTTASAGVASLAAGIPAECSLPIASGGAYTRRTDANGAHYIATSHNFFMQNGGQYTFDSSVSTAIGGYPLGALLWATVGGETVVVKSLKNNNTDDFVTTPSLIDGVSWGYAIALKTPANPFINYALFTEEYATTTAAQALSTGQNTRHLNTEKINNIAGTTFNSSTYTIEDLPAGTYRVIASGACNLSEAASTSRLNIYDGSDIVAYGMSSATSTDDDNWKDTITCVFTLATAKDITLRHYVSTNLTGGIAVSDGSPEVYATLEIWKLD